jgi:uncharacterized glyoxalase superfamily metalloenzyme YdcJ
MVNHVPSLGAALVTSMLGERAAAVLATIDLDAPLGHDAGPGLVSRICFAAALNAVLFDDLLRRVPTGAAFVADQLARGERISFDHGALRTIRFPMGQTGALPAGQEAFARILEPLGYAVAGTYPLPRLRMTGRAWAHRDLPEQLPQFFISELHVEQFAPPFAAVAEAVFGESRDPLSDKAKSVLDDFAREGEVAVADAMLALPIIVAAFARQHPLPAIADYQLLLDQSAEAAWIATEGNAFNHATSRVADIGAEAERQRARGLPIKDSIEVSRNGRVRQTAFRADPVTRSFRDANGPIAQAVPGSFYEIITRDIDPATGALDLSFDSGNATGIFAMTRAS